MKDIMQYIKLLRIKHYLKNILILVPFVSGHKMFEYKMYPFLLVGILSFSLVSSMIYIVNDIQDVEKDRCHPVKCKRPIASGKISVGRARNVCVVLLLLSIFSIMALYYWCGAKEAILVLIAYAILNVFYSLFGWKNIPLLDVIILVFGFVLRVIYGALLANVMVSYWLYLVVIMVSFYLALGKRRNELKKYGEKGEKRNVLKYYSYGFLDKNMYMCMSLAITFYSLWSVDKNVIKSNANGSAIWTVPLVMIIAMKYSLNIEGDSEGDPVDVILSDKILIMLVIIYCLIMYFIVYGV